MKGGRICGIGDCRMKQNGADFEVAKRNKDKK